MRLRRRTLKGPSGVGRIGPVTVCSFALYDERGRQVRVGTFTPLSVPDGSYIQGVSLHLTVEPLPRPTFDVRWETGGGPA